MAERSSKNKAGDRKQPNIFCDMCAEEDRRAAVKTCMKCEISMCDVHLQPHLTTPVLIVSHHLTDPMAPGAEGLGATKCPQHGKLLEYYCLDDLTSVCVSCAIEDKHRHHNMKTFPKAHAELVGKIADEERVVAVRREESEDLGKWERSKREEVSRSSVRLIDAVSKLRDMTLDRVQSSVSARMGVVTTGGRSIQAAKAEKDTFRFLQLYSQVQQDVERAKAVDLREGLEKGQECDKLSQELQKVGAGMVDQATKLCGLVLMFVDPENQGGSPGNVNAIFEPCPFGHGMSLSADNKKAYHTQVPGILHQCTLTIKDANSESPLHRWKIAVSENYDWKIGFCLDESRTGRGCVYALCIKDDQLSYLCIDDTQLGNAPLPIPGAERLVRPKTVEVCWNPQVYSLSFLDCSSPHDQRKLIISIDVRNSSAVLKPFVELLSSQALQTQMFGQNLPISGYASSFYQLRAHQNISYHYNSVNGQTPVCELL